MMLRAIFCVAIVFSSVALAGVDQAPDLNRVTMHEAPKNDPVVLVENGVARGSICVMGKVDRMALGELQRCVKLATGVDLPVVKGDIKEPAIVIGDCADAAAAGCLGSQLPVEGLQIKTAPNRVYLVGNGPGLSWAIYELLERYVGARWYFVGDLGRFVPQNKILVVPAVDLTDAPVFQKRELWPVTSNPSNGSGTDMRGLHQALRSYDSSPVRLQVHTPNYAHNEDYKKNRPEIFEMKEDGTRNWEMLCYSNPRTLETFLENIQKRLDGDNSVNIGLIGDTITVSPNDAEINCHCPECRKLWDENGGGEGTASRIVATFTQKLAREVKKRWPNIKVIQLAYLNYDTCPTDVALPDNVYLQICGMPGMALYSQAAIFDAEEKNLIAWQQLTGKKVQNWLYICWPEDRTKAVFAYPHTLQKYYQLNRDKTVGSFINGGTDHWPRQGLTLYCWLKLLWNPDFDVDAAIDAYANNMYGPASAPMRQLMQLQMDGWEKVNWPSATLTARAVYKFSYPKPIREQMKNLLADARKQAAADKTVLARINYYATPFAEFFAEGEEMDDTSKRTVITVQHVASQPVIDAKLNEDFWAKTLAVKFVPAIERDKKQVKFPTTLRAVWNDGDEKTAGVTFAIECSDPAPDAIQHKRTGRDTPDLFWYDDCVELLLDPSGKYEGDYYHFMVTAGGAWSDAHDGDLKFNATHAKVATQITDKGWTMEMFVPFADFPQSLRPGNGKEVMWYGNFTRHRMGEHVRRDKSTLNSEEYQRVNTTFAGPTNNLADFGPIRFLP